MEGHQGKEKRPGTSRVSRSLIDAIRVEKKRKRGKEKRKIIRYVTILLLFFVSRKEEDFS